MNNPLVSAVILTRNRGVSLRRCIKSLINNTYNNIEIVVYDNGSKLSQKENVSFITNLKAKCDIKHIKSSPKGFAEMRQIAVSHSSGEIIMSIDDDCVAEKKAIENIVQKFRSDEKIGIIGGNITNIGFSGKERFKGRALIGVNGKYEVVENPEEAEVFGSANMSIKRQAFADVCGYDLFFTGGFEEADLILSIKRAGYKIVYDPSVKIKHYLDDNKRYRQKKRNLTMLRLYLFFKHFMPRNLRGWRQFVKNEKALLKKELSWYAPPSNARQSKRKLGILTPKDEWFYDLSKVILIFNNVVYKRFTAITTRLLIPYLILRGHFYKQR